MKFLVTGSAGFIGFHVARRLLGEGHEVTGFDGMTPYYDVSLKERRHAILSENANFRAVIGMLEDRPALQVAAEQARPDVIIHLAAQAGVRYSLENPKAYVDSNLIGAWNILEVAKDLEVGHLLLASTSSVYGANEKVPFEETDRADEPLTLYAATKKSTEVMAHSYSHLWKIPTTVFRFFTVYGPWGRPDMALFKFVNAIERGEPIDIYAEGRMRRDFTYVDDLVEGVLQLAALVPGEDNRAEAEGDTLSRHAPYRIVNIGGGQPIGLLDFVEVVERALGKTAIRNMMPMQKGDVPQTFASPRLLKALTGYVPETDLETGVGAFVDWFLNEYQPRKI